MTTTSSIAERNCMLRAKFAAMVIVLLLLLAGTAHAAEVIPAVPDHYFNDYAGVVSPATVDDLNRQLEQFERDTSNQVRVVVYPKMQSDSDIADYTVRVAQSWHVGMKGKDNGVVLFVFVEDRKAFIQVGYGLEGSLPDATCKYILDQTITPRFKVGDYDGGLRAAVAAILAATKGEYKGTGQTANEQIANSIISEFPCIASAIGLFVLFGLLLLILHTTGGTFYQSHVRSIGLFENIYLFIIQMGLNVVFSAGSSSSSSGGGSGSASSGGGSFGGGGAGGSW